MISLCMIVKNEEKNLEHCLSSVKGCVDEIIIVDTGSTDQTLKIAEQYNAKIFFYKWNDNFAEARNFAIRQANSEWILYLDADEYINPNSLLNLKHISKTKINKAYYCRILNINEETNRPSIMLYPRLFPNIKNIKFIGAVHEQIESSLIEFKIPIVKSNIEIIHTGYNLSLEEQKKKAVRNKNILKKEFILSPNSYNAFQLGQTYGILNNPAEAEKYFLIALSDRNLRKEFRSTAFRYIALNKANEGNLVKALELINNSLHEDNKQPLALMAAAEINKKSGNLNDALTFCKRAHELNNQISIGKIDSFQNIFMDEASIINYGIELSLLLKNTVVLNYFLNTIKNIDDKFYKLIFAIISHKDIEVNNNYLSLVVSANNLEFLNTVLFLNYINVNTSKKIYLQLTEIFPGNMLVNYFAGKFFMSIYEFSIAEKFLIVSIDNGNNDPTAFVKLISVLVNNRKIKEAKKFLLIALEKFQDNSQIQQIFIKVQNKLKQID